MILYYSFGLINSRFPEEDGIGLGLLNSYLLSYQLWLVKDGVLAKVRDQVLVKQECNVVAV